MFIAALLMVVNIWKQPECPLMDEWVNKIGCVCTHWNTIQSKDRRESLQCATTWVNLKDILLNEIN